MGASALHWPSIVATERISVKGAARYFRILGGAVFDGVELAHSEAKRQRLPLLGVKAGNRIQTDDVQLGKPRMGAPNYCIRQALQFSIFAG